MPPDFLHDWEIGVGKAVTAHNVRIFHAIGGGTINEFDARYVCESVCYVHFNDPDCNAGSVKS